jgi:SSS family solute:Na+ symporter
VQSPVLSGLVGAGVLAAIMSSLDSQFMCLGTMFTNDIVAYRLGPNRLGDRQKVLLARGFILLVVGITYGLSVWLMDSAHVFDLGVWCFSGFAALFPLVLAAVYWKRTTLAGAFASILVTALVWGVLFYRDIIAEKPPGAEDELLIWGMMPVTFILAASAAALVVVSLLTRKPSAETIRKFFP